MAWYDTLENSPFGLSNNAPPPELLNLPQQEIPPAPQQFFNKPQPQPPNFAPYTQQHFSSPVNNFSATGFQRGIVAAKNAYNQLENYSNALLPYLQNGNDKQKQWAQNEINSARNYQNELADTADMWRTTARGLGIDTAGFNKENTLAESQQLLQLNDARAIQGLLDFPSTQAQQRDYYQQMINSGLSPRLAEQAASQKFNEFRENTANQLLNGFQNYGFNNDGSINQFGAVLLSKLTTENPYLAEPLFKALPTPQNAYSEMNANQRLLAQLQGQSDQYDRNFRNELIKLQKVQDFTREENERAAKLEMLKTALKGTGVAQDKMDAEIQSLTRLFGGDQQKASELYLAQHYGNGLKLLNNNSEILKDEQKLANFTDGCFGAIEYFIKTGNYEQASTLIEDFKTKLLGDDFKYAESMNSARMQYFLTKLDLYDKAATNKFSPTELQELMNGGRGNSSADLSRENNNTYAINKAKKIGEQAAREQAELQHRKAQQEKYSAQNYWNPTPSINYNKYPVYSPFDYNKQ